jgi:TolA-binding protein
MIRALLATFLLVATVTFFMALGLSASLPTQAAEPQKNSSVAERPAKAQTTEPQNKPAGEKEGATSTGEAQTPELQKKLDALNKRVDDLENIMKP